MPLTKPVYWGLINTCRSIHKVNEDGETLYEGEWFRMRQTDLGIIQAIVDHGIQWVTQCFTDCATNENYPDGTTCLIMECRLLLHLGDEAGKCYPARCSPAEILIATVEDATINNTSAYPLGVYGLDIASPEYAEPKYSYANDGL